jgi:hypothetical protein
VDSALNTIEGLAETDGVCTCIQCVDLIAIALRKQGFPASAAIVERLKAMADNAAWIDREERVPNRNGKYLTCGWMNNMHVSTFHPGLYGVRGFAQNVTHWMPLPEPPK